MRSEDYELTKRQLEAKANACFEQAESEDPNVDSAERLQHYFEGQFYLNTLAKKSDDRNTRRSFWMEAAVIVLIGVEIMLGLIGIHEGRQQSKVLEHMDQSAASTAKTMDALQKAQGDTLEKIREQTGLLGNAQENLRGQLGLSKQQFDLAREQFDAQNKRPILQVRAILYDIATNRSRSSEVLNSNQPAGYSSGDMNLLLEPGGSLQANFIIRNVGTADAVNVTIEPQLGPGVKLRCISYSGYLPSVPVGTQSQPCDYPSSPVTISAFREGIKPYPSKPGSITPDIDSMHDVLAQIHLYVEKGTQQVWLVFTVNANGLIPQRYALFGHNFYPDGVGLPANP